MQVSHAASMESYELPLLLPASIGKLIRPFEPQLMRLLFTDTLMRSYDCAIQGGARAQISQTVSCRRWT